MVDRTRALWRNLYEPFGSFGPLVTPDQVLAYDRAAGMTRYSPAELKGLTSFASYTKNFLPNPHAQLGRPGAVCPFTSGALERGFLRLTATPLASADDALIIETVSQMRPVFEALGGHRADEIFKAIVILFPLLPESEAAGMIERVQKQLKPGYVAAGMMIGEFYPGCPAPGLHNVDFKPLQAPVASLAIRRITIYDAPFMIDDDRYLEGYVGQFGDEGIRRIRAILDRPDYFLAPARRKLIERGWGAMMGGSDGRAS